MTRMNSFQHGWHQRSLWVTRIELMQSINKSGEEANRGLLAKCPMPRPNQVDWLFADEGKALKLSWDYTQLS